MSTSIVLYSRQVFKIPMTSPPYVTPYVVLIDAKNPIELRKLASTEKSRF